MAEMALVLPILLGLASAGIDLARVYQSWITLQSATRNAAEYAAMNDASASQAQIDARRIVCLETAGLPDYVAGATADTCTAPTVNVNSFVFDSASTVPGGILATATVTAALDFRPFFPYPFVTSNGVVTLSVTETYSVAQVPF